MINTALWRRIGVYDVEGRCGCVGGDRPLCDGVGNVECRIIADLVNSVEISLCTGTGISIFLIGMYRLGMSDNAFRTVNSRVNAITPANTPVAT